MNKKYILLLLVSITAFMSCSKKQTSPKKKELLIYCGTTMIKPIMEIKKIIEKENDCTILVTKGGSGNLLKSLKINNIGDLYFPGSDSYIKQCEKEQLISDTAFVGYNKIAIMVQKGNPKNISSDLNNFKRKDLVVVIGNPESGSIGKETQRVFIKKGIYKEVTKNAYLLTTDSKKLFQVLKDKKADIVMNWYSAAFVENHKKYLTVLEIDDKFVRKKKLVIGLLKTSKYPEIAKRFMEYAQSPAGKDIFRKYGFGK